MKVKIMCIVLSLVLVFSCLCGCNVKNKTCTATFDGTEVSGTYTGGFSAKLPEDTGLFIAGTEDTTWTYDGGFTAGTPSGEGTFTDYPCNMEIQGETVSGTYTGAAIDGEADGDGVFTINYDDGTSAVYEGSFSAGSIAAGTVSDLQYDLTYDEDVISGIYNGEMADGMFSGTGTFESSDEEIVFTYDGGWLDGAMSGDGTLEYSEYVAHFPDLDRVGEYSGETVDGIPSNGTYCAYNDENDYYIYDGEWADGIFNGQGVMTFPENLDEYYTRTGTFVDGSFTPNVLEFIKSFGDIGGNDLSFEVTDNAEAFISAHMDLFPAASYEDIEEYVDSSITYDMLSKACYKYGDALIETGSYEVIQIDEIEDFWGLTRTMMIVCNYDVDEIYYIVFNGTLDDVYVGSYVNTYGIPVAYSSYQNVGGGTTKCIILYASYVE